MAEKADKEIGFEIIDNKVIIRYVKKVHFYRMLSVIQNVNTDKYIEIPRHDNLCYIADQSFNMESAKRMVRCHKAFKNNIAFAGGVQKWGDFVSVSKLTLDIEGMHIDKCIEHGIKDIMTTGWGDNGAETFGC